MEDRTSPVQLRTGLARTSQGEVAVQAPLLISGHKMSPWDIRFQVCAILPCFPLIIYI